MALPGTRGSELWTGALICLWAVSLAESALFSLSAPESDEVSSETCDWSFSRSAFWVAICFCKERDSLARIVWLASSSLRDEMSLSAAGRGLANYRLRNSCPSGEGVRPHTFALFVELPSELLEVGFRFFNADFAKCPVSQVEVLIFQSDFT